VAEEMKLSYGKETNVTADDIAITSGCNLAFVAAIITLAEKGDEVILPVPWYFNHEMTLSMLGITTIVLWTSPEAGFLPSPAECEKLITPNTKAIVLVTPNNPTGAIYPAPLLASFASLAKAHNIALVIDETYRDFLVAASLPPHRLFSPPSSVPTPDIPSNWDWRATLIHLFSFSKSYCIPGHRVGLLCASPQLMPSLNVALDNIQICAPRPPQIALASVLPALRPFVRANAQALQHRHSLFASLLPKSWTIGAQGGYYAFVKHPFVDIGSKDVCKRLAEQMGVICLPAGFFGPSTLSSEESVSQPAPSAEVTANPDERWVRFSVANVDDEKVKLVCERLAECVEVFGWKVEH